MKYRKSLVLWLTFILMIVVIPGCGSSEKFIGNSSSKKFHKPACQWAQKISSSNRIAFSSRDEAVKSGYSPCKVCHP